MNTQSLRIPGSYLGIDLPQRGSIAKIAYGSGYPELDDLFKFYPGQFTVVTGLAGSGKSTFMFNVLCKMALEQGIGPWMYVPENEASLLEKLERLWPGNAASYDHFLRHQLTVQSAVPHQIREPFHDIDWALEKAAWSVKVDRREIVLLDPWNEFDRYPQKGQLMTEYIGEALMKIKQFCRYLNVPVIMIAHPTKNVLQREDRTITLGDIEGSMNWWNKCDNGLIISRNDKVATVVSAKVREHGAGKIGQCHFNVDPDTEKFTTLYGSTVNVIP